MNAFQAPQTPPVRPHPDKPATADAHPSPATEGAEAQTATPEPAPPQERQATGEDMSGWAMGGSD